MSTVSTGSSASTGSFASTASTIAEVTGLLTSDFDLATLLRTIAERTRTELDAMLVALVVAEVDGSIGVVARSAGARVQVDSRMHRRGPAELCARSGAVVMVDDVTAPLGPWPQYRQLARECGFGSVRAYPLTLSRKPLGALVIHAAGTWGNDRSGMYAQAMADLAAVALGSSEPTRRTESSGDAVRALVASIAVIDQAIGMLAEINDVEVEVATQLLQRGAVELGLSIDDAARRLVTGERPRSGRDRRDDITG